MTSDEIRLELFKIRKSGGNMSHIARNMKPPCTRQAISAVIDRAIASRRIALAVSATLGLDMRIVFPEYFSKKEKLKKNKQEKK